LCGSCKCCTVILKEICENVFRGITTSNDSSFLQSLINDICDELAPKIDLECVFQLLAEGRFLEGFARIRGEPLIPREKLYFCLEYAGFSELEIGYILKHNQRINEDHVDLLIRYPYVLNVNMVNDRKAELESLDSTTILTLEQKQELELCKVYHYIINTYRPELSRKINSYIRRTLEIPRIDKGFILLLLKRRCPAGQQCPPQ